MCKNETKNPTGINTEVKVELKKLFKEITDDWLLQVGYSIEITSMNPPVAEQKALEQYRNWVKRLETLLEYN